MQLKIFVTKKTPPARRLFIFVLTCSQTNYTQTFCRSVVVDVGRIDTLFKQAYTNTADRGRNCGAGEVRSGSPATRFQSTEPSPTDIHLHPYCYYYLY